MIIGVFFLLLRKEERVMFIAPVRTLTLGIAAPHPLSAAHIRHASAVLQQASRRVTEAGYEVQTVRLSTRPIFTDLADWSPAALLSYVRELQQMLDDEGLQFCSLGSAAAAAPNFPLVLLDPIPDLLAATTALSATVQVASEQHGLRAEAARPTARIIQRLAHETEEGFGNFRFAMLACVPPGCPFFPAAYHEGVDSLALGVQGVGLIAQALRAVREEQDVQAEGPLPLGRVTERVRTVLETYMQPLVELGRELALEHDLHFQGIDLSPAPMGQESIVAALELCGYGLFGSPGTLAATAAITAALKSTTLPMCGYSGLMLPVLEDATLGQRWSDGLVNAHTLLLYSSVCGTGLDTLPLPGTMPIEAIEHLLLDVAILAVRLHKPLSARLFPVPRRVEGEYTSFTSPYLTNTLIRF